MIPQKQIDDYLVSLRSHLGPMTLSEREEIVREIGAHIRDSAEEGGGNIWAVLDRLGPAEALAAQYSDGMLIRRASRSISPVLLLRGAARLATKGVSGIVVFLVGVFGYAIGGGLVLTALVKPILPANTGMWFNGGEFVSSGVLFPAPPPPAHEVLGVWYIPLALTAGSLILFATMFLIRNSLRLSQQWQLKLGQFSHSS
jgi:uncharacterized membrane protein